MRQRTRRFVNNDSWKNEVIRMEPEDFQASVSSNVENFGGPESSRLDDSEYEYGSMLEENIASHLESNPSSLNIHKIGNKKSIDNNSTIALERNRYSSNRNTVESQGIKIDYSKR